MEIKAVAKKLPEIIKKYKYVALILIIGIVLMLIPGKSDNTLNASQPEERQMVYDNTLYQDLISILSKVDGAGRVEVMLTVSKGEEVVYQINTNQSSADQSNNMQRETVIISDSSRNEQGMIVRTDPPRYLGAVILCQGADSSVVRLAVMEAVSKATGLTSDRICVLKMK